MSPVKQRFEEVRGRLKSHGQGHLLAHWPALDDHERDALLDDIAQIDLDLCAGLIETHVKRSSAAALPTQIDPAPILPAEPGPEQIDLYRRARRRGEEAVAAGRVAAFTVAGGQGTRLGYDGPKGAFAISPVRSACLFQLFAEYLLGVQRRYGRCPRWYIMTSPANDAQTRAFFDSHRHFGLAPDDLIFFQQGQMPAFLPDGRITLAAPHRVALGPDGHGGSLRALRGSGALDDMRERGIEQVSYFQVDNPLARPIDPLFIGLHLALDSEMSSKAVTKADDLERVGNFCVADGKPCVIEYSDLPEALARAHHANGTRRFDAGSIAIHVISRAFVERLTAARTELRLPWHRADKQLPVLTTPEAAEPQPTGVVKLELFVFDAIPLARNSLMLYTTRAEEFSPVKNADGVDSPATTRRDLVRRAARWLEACGTDVPRGPDGEPAQPIEISPARALDATDLRSQLSSPPILSPSEPYLLA